MLHWCFISHCFIFLTSSLPTKTSYPEYMDNSYKLIRNKEPNRKWAKSVNRHVTNEKMANNYEKYSASVVIRETPFKKANETNKQAKLMRC